MEKNVDTLNANLMANFSAGLEYFDKTIFQLYGQNENKETHDSTFEISCIALEFCSFLFWVNILISSITKYQSKKIIDFYSFKLIDFYEKYAANLRGKYSLTVLPATVAFDYRSQDYGTIYQGDYVPCGFYLLNDYKRYPNLFQDGLMRCSIAYGDFSVYYIKNHKRANFKDIDPIIVLDIFDMPFYTHIFEQTGNIILTFCDHAFKILGEYKSAIDSVNNPYRNNNDLTKPISVTYAPPKSKYKSNHETDKSDDWTIYKAILYGGAVIVILTILTLFFTNALT